MEMLGANFVEPWLSGADAQNRSAIEAMTLTAAAFARGGYLPVIDFVIGPWHLDVVNDSCHLANVGCHLVVLLRTLGARLHPTSALMQATKCGQLGLSGACDQ